MERTTFSPPKEHRRGRAEEPNSLDDGSKLSKEDPVVAFDLEPSGTKQETHLRPNSAPEFAVSTLLSPYELSRTNTLEPAVEWTPEDPDMSLEPCGPLCEEKPRPVVSPWLNHSPPHLPFEDIILDGEIQTHAALVEDLSRQTKNAPVNIPDSDPASLSAFSEILNNADVKSQHFENILNPAELVSFQMRSQPSVQPHDNDLAHLQTPYLIPEYSVPVQLQPEPNVWLQESDQGHSSTAELGHSFPLPCFEPTEKAAVLPFKDNLKPAQHVISQPHLGQSAPRDDTDLVSARGLQLPFTSVQPLRLSAGTFQDLSGPPRHLHAPSFSQYHSTKLHLNARQTPVLSDSDPQPVQLIRPPYLPLVLPLDVNCVQPDNQLASVRFQPCLQPLPYPFISDMRLIPASIAIDNWAPLSSSSVLVPHFNPPLCYKDPLFISPHLQTNISSHLAHPNARGPLRPGGLEQPSVVQSTCDGHSHSQKLYENYRLWQIYCEVAKSVYTSSPDAEALACFFIPVIRSVTLQCPEIPFSEAVKTAVSEWEKHSNFDRMEYYHIAQKFMDFEEEKLKCLRAEEEARAIQETVNHQQIPTLKHEQSVKPTGYHLGKSGAGSRGAKGGSTTSRGGQSLRRDVQDLAGEALREYSEIMEALETKNKGGSEETEEEEEVHGGDEEEGPFAEYLNELCSQKKFVSEVGAEIDMAYISSLLSSELNAIDMLMQPVDLDNSQDVPNSVSVASAERHLNGQITDSDSQNHPQTTSQSTETSAQKVKSNSDVARETSLFETTTVNELRTTEKNENECVIGEQKITESTPDIQEDNNGTDMAFLVMEDAVEQICSAAQLLHKDNSDVSVDCEAGHLEEVTLISTHSCSGLDPPRTLSPLASIATLERETPQEDSETSPGVNQVCEEASQTDKQSNAPQQEGAVTDSKTEVSTTELSPNIVQHDDAVTQNEFAKHDPVTEDHSGKTRDPIASPPNRHEESSTHLVNTSTVCECLDVDTQSELSTTRLDSTSDEVGPKLATHLKDVAVEIPQEHVDGGTEVDSSPDDNAPSGTVEDTGRKELTETDAEVTDKIDGQTDSEGTLTVEDNEIKVSDVETEDGIKAMTSNISQQTYVASPGCPLVQNDEQAAEVTQIATEVLSTTEEEGNTSAGEKTTAENSLCMSGEELCLDQKTGQHKQDKGNIKSTSLVTTNAGDLCSRNKIQSEPTEILNENKCDDQKTRSDDGRANERMTRSKTKAQKIEETVGTANREMEKMGQRKRVGDSFVTNKTSLTRKPELTLENAPVITEKGQSECKCSLKNENRDMKRKDGPQGRKDDDHLAENTTEKATKTTINLEVGASLLKEKSSESKNVRSKSTKTESADERVQSKTGGNRSTDTRRNKSKRKMDIIKGLRRERSAMVKRQNLKVAIGVARTVKDQRNEVTRSTRRCKVKEIPTQKQQRMINEEKMQTPSRSERLSKKEPEKNMKSDHCSVMDTRRSFDSLRSDKAAGTSSVKMKTKKPNAGNPMLEKEADIRYHQVEAGKVTNKASKMSNSSSGIQTGSFDTALVEEIQSRQIPIDRLVDIPRITRSFVANVVKRTRTTEKLVVDREEVAEIMTCSSERAKKVKVRTEESPQLNRARGTRHCGALAAEETAEELAKIKDGELSSGASEGKCSNRRERRSRSASVLGISIAVKDKSKETTENKNRDGRRRYDRVKRQNQASIRAKRQIRSCTASRLLQMKKRGKEGKKMDEAFSKSSADQKKRRFLREERDKAKKDAEGRTTRSSAGSLRTLAVREQKHQEVAMRRKRTIQGEMETQRRRIRKEIAKGTTGQTRERKELENHQRSRRLCRGLKSQAWSRSLRKLKVLATPQTRQRVERRNDGQKETVESPTRPKRARNERRLGSLPIKKQKQTEKQRSGSKFQVANPSNRSAEANDTPSSSKTLRRTLKRGSRATPVTHRQKRGQQGSACSSSVLRKKTEGEKKGGERQSGRRDIPSVNRQKGRGGKRDAGKKSRGNKEQKKKEGIQERWCDRLGKMQKRKARR